jgi:hypothetical protein
MVCSTPGAADPGCGSVDDEHRSIAPNPDRGQPAEIAEEESGGRQFGT